MLTDFRNGLMQLVGAMAERQAFSTLTSRKRKPHQEQPTSIYGKTGKRRARKSLVEIVRTLELAENAGNAEAVVRSSGSNWPFCFTNKHNNYRSSSDDGRSSERANERALQNLARQRFIPRPLRALQVEDAERLRGRGLRVALLGRDLGHGLVGHDGHCVRHRPHCRRVHDAEGSLHFVVCCFCFTSVLGYDTLHTYKYRSKLANTFAER